VTPRGSISERLLGAFEVILGSLRQVRPYEAPLSEARWEMLGLFVP
jgi:hypothetical protein